MAIVVPRVLFASSEAPHDQAAGSIVFQRLFSSWPTDRLLVVTNSPPPAGAGKLGCRYETIRLPADRLIRTRFAQWRIYLRLFGAVSFVPLWLISRHLQGFSPEVVVTLLQDSWMYELAARFARASNLPLVIFGHDLPEIFEGVNGRLRARQAARDSQIYRQAAHRMCVSDGMVAHYRQKFSLEGEVLLPPRSPKLKAAGRPSTVLKNGSGLTIGYAGGLHYGYGEQLLQMLPVLRETNTRLELFGPRPEGSIRALASATDVIRFNGFQPTPEDAWEILRTRCDAVLQPYLNPPQTHQLQYRTHFPSKLGDCLALGLPLLITGPPEASGVRWCLEHPGCAEIVSTADGAALRAAIERLRDDAQHRHRLIEVALSLASHFDLEQISDQMTRAIASAARLDGPS